MHHQVTVIIEQSNSQEKLANVESEGMDIHPAMTITSENKGD